MIAIQGYKNSTDSIIILFDTNGIDEFIGYLNEIKGRDSSMHLNIDNELSRNDDIEDSMHIIPHVKIVNIDRLDSL